MHRLCEYTLISFKCQSIRSKVHCTNKTLHNEWLKNVTVHVGQRVTCAKNLTRVNWGTYRNPGLNETFLSFPRKDNVYSLTSTKHCDEKEWHNY